MAATEDVVETSVKLVGDRRSRNSVSVTIGRKVRCGDVFVHNHLADGVNSARRDNVSRERCARRRVNNRCRKPGKVSLAKVGLGNRRGWIHAEAIDAQALIGTEEKGLVLENGSAGTSAEVICDCACRQGATEVVGVRVQPVPVVVPESCSMKLVRATFGDGRDVPDLRVFGAII